MDYEHILELQEKYSQKREEMRTATQQLNDQTAQLAATCENVIAIASDLQTICNEFDQLEFTFAESGSMEEREPSSNEPSSTSAFGPPASETYDASASVSYELQHGLDDYRYLIGSESSGVGLDSDQVLESSDGESKNPTDNESSPFSIRSNLPCEVSSPNPDSVTDSDARDNESQRSGGVDETPSSSLVVSKVSVMRTKAAKRPLEEIPCRLLWKLPGNSTEGNVSKRALKVPGKKYGRREGLDESILPWLPIDSQDISAGSDIKFKYQLGDELQSFRGEVVQVMKYILTVRLNGPGNEKRNFWKTKMEEVMVQSNAQAAGGGERSAAF